jgi:mono/diheme cytochrome c family protein
LKGFVIGLIFGVLLVFGGVYFYFASGSAPVGTDAQAMPFEKKFAHMALNARVEKEMPKSVPFQANEAAYLGGADVYRQDCAVCHGLPAQPATAIAKGMFPKPPVLLEGKGVTDDPAEETYWKVANGIRMTGMPAFKRTLSDEQMWQVSLLLANADKVPQSVKDKLTASTPGVPVVTHP